MLIASSVPGGGGDSHVRTPIRLRIVLADKPIETTNRLLARTVG